MKITVSNHTKKNTWIFLFGLIPIFWVKEEYKEKGSKETPPPKAPHFSTVEIIFNHTKTKGGLKMTKTYLDSDAKGKRARVSFGSPINAAGNAAPVEAGSVKFESTNEEVATVTPVEGSDFEVDVDFTGKPGSADVVITADADLSNDNNDETPEDEKIITGLVTFVIESGMAVGFNSSTSIGELSDTPQPAGE